MRVLKRETGIIRDVKADGRETFLTVEMGFIFGIRVSCVGIYRDMEKLFDGNNTHYSLHSAQQTIDQHIKDIERDKQKKADKKVVKREFIKYP